MTKRIISIVFWSVLAVLAMSAPAAAQGAGSGFGGEEPLSTNVIDGEGSFIRTSVDMALGWRQIDSLSLLVASGYTPYTGKWHLLDPAQPTVLHYGLNGGRVGLVGNDSLVWFFSPTAAKWSLEAFGSVSGHAAGGVTAIAWGDGDKALGFSTYLNDRTTHSLSGSGYTGAAFDKGLTTAAILFNDIEALGYSAYNNSWTQTTLSGKPLGHSAGTNIGVIWNNDTLYGYSPLYSTWETKAIDKPVVGVAGDWLAVVYNTKAFGVYDGQSHAWFDGHNVKQSFPPIVRVGKEVALVWADKGAWAFDVRRDHWYDTGIVPGNQLSYLGEAAGNTLLLWNNDMAWGYNRYDNVPASYGDTVVLDGTPATARATTGGTVIFNTNTAYGLGRDALWASQPLDPAKTYEFRMVGNAAVLWSSDQAFVFNCDTNAWTEIVLANPVGVGGAASSNHAIVWTDTRAYAYDIETDTVYEIDLTGMPVLGHGALWATAVVDDSDKVYTFSSETLAWTTQQLNASPLTLRIKGHEVIVLTTDTAYGYTGMLGAWSSQALDSPGLLVNLGFSCATITTMDSVYAHSAFTGTWAEQPLP